MVVDSRFRAARDQAIALRKSLFCASRTGTEA